MKNLIDQFVEQYVAKPTSRSQESLADDVCKWVAVANDPGKFHPSANEFELRIHRRNARQNVRRILVKHPESVPLVTKLMERKATEQSGEARNAL